MYGAMKENGHVQGGSRPMVIVSNNIGNRFSPMYMVIPFTTRRKKPQPTHVRFKAGTAGLTQDSLLLAEQQCPINKEDILYKMGELTDDEMVLVARAMVISSPITYLAFQDGIQESETFQKVAMA